MGLKTMDLMQIINDLGASGGVGVRYDGKPYPIRQGETALQYAHRVMEEHNAWKAGQAATVSSENESPDTGSDGRGQWDDPVDGVPDESHNEGHVPTRETGLEETIEAQVSSLRRLAGEWERKSEEASRNRDKYSAELKIAERFLHEMQSEIHNEDSPDVPDKEGEEQGGG